MPISQSNSSFLGSNSNHFFQNQQNSIQIKKAQKKSFLCKNSKEEPMNIAVVGATGLVGSRLIWRLVSFGHRVHVLTRDINKAKLVLEDYPTLSYYNPENWNDGISGCDGVVNLAGEPIATRWSDEIKKEIKDSRINTTNKIVNLINGCSENDRPKVLVNSSAIGYYGTSLEKEMDEGSPNGSDYLSEICREWESAAMKSGPGTRVVILRTGIVLAKEGGALSRMIPVFKIFAGGPLGTGQQWISWIHRDDLIELIMISLKNSKYKGIYNATAPNPVRMNNFCNILGQVMGRPSWLPVPEIALNALLGEGAMLVVEGQKVMPKRTMDEGFSFKYNDIKEALKMAVN